MRRALAFTLAIPAALMLAGCPVYPDDPDCFSDAECAPGFACHSPSGTCFAINGTGGGSGGARSCSEPKACGVNETCGKDARCQVGTCAFHGCVKGFVCAVDDGVWSCVRGEGGQGGAAGAAGASGAGGAAGSAGSAGTGEAGAAGDSGVADGAGPLGDSGVAGAAGSDAGSGGASGSSADSGTTDARTD